MSSIWHHRPDIETINNSINQGTICEQLDIRVTEVGDDFIKGTMPADARTFQPFGVVHGGANVVLAESLGSIGGAHVIDISQAVCLGQEVSAQPDLFIWGDALRYGKFVLRMIRGN
jgi:1,4-dihydroxy-2-naphthoyl-CoA hydrolase